MAKRDKEIASQIELIASSPSAKTLDTAMEKVTSVFRGRIVKGPVSMPSEKGEMPNKGGVCKLHRRMILINKCSQEDIEMLENIHLPSLLHLDFKVL